MAQERLYTPYEAIRFANSDRDTADLSWMVIQWETNWKARLPP